MFFIAQISFEIENPGFILLFDLNSNSMNEL